MTFFFLCGNKKIMEDERGPPRVPPASKEVVAKLPIITITEEILGKLGKDVECAICKENLVVNDEMQELPCKHTFHPPCLKPWLVIPTFEPKKSIADFYDLFLLFLLFFKLEFDFVTYDGRMSTILAQYVDTSCKQTIMSTRAGRRERGRLRKRGKVLQMLFVVVNTCMFSLVQLLCGCLTLYDSHLVLLEYR